MEYTSVEIVDLKGKEAWVQQQIKEDPRILGLGDLELLKSEKRQQRTGRLDLLLSDPSSSARYVVEIQLGKTDESHIIRTLEYWDKERRRLPQIDHYGVLVAEDITARFFNVIGLFNGVIPMIAIQMKCVRVDEKRVGLIFTTLLDHSPAAPEDDEKEEPKDRAYWEQKATKSTIALADRLLTIAQEIAPGYQLKYNKHYIGVAKDGLTENFVTFRPRKKDIQLDVKLKKSAEVDQLIEKHDIDTLAYDSIFKYYALKLDASGIEKHHAILKDLIEMAYRNWVGE